MRGAFLVHDRIGYTLSPSGVAPTGVEFLLWKKWCLLLCGIKIHGPRRPTRKGILGKLLIFVRSWPNSVPLRKRLENVSMKAERWKACRTGTHHTSTSTTTGLRSTKGEAALGRPSGI